MGNANHDPSPGLSQGGSRSQSDTYRDIGLDNGRAVLEKDDRRPRTAKQKRSSSSADNAKQKKQEHQHQLEQSPVHPRSACSIRGRHSSKSHSSHNHDLRAPTGPSFKVDCLHRPVLSYVDMAGANKSA